MSATTCGYCSCSEAETAMASLDTGKPETQRSREAGFISSGQQRAS